MEVAPDTDLGFIKMSKYMFLLFAAVITGNLFAEPVEPQLKKSIRLQNGSLVETTLVGDEHGFFYYDERHDVFYQKVVGDEIFEPITLSEIEEKQKQLRHPWISSKKVSSDIYPFGVAGYKGKHTGLVVLVELSDCQFAEWHNTTYYEKIFNEHHLQDDQLAGSVKDYFMEQSNGQFELDFDVFGPIRMTNPTAYYGSDSIDGTYKLDAKLGEMVVKACKGLDDSIDFSKYDWDGDGKVEQVGILYAGISQSYVANMHPEYIWAQKSDIGRYGMDKELILDGVEISTFFCSSEMRSDVVSNGIGTFCHEFSHCMGLPDMYNLYDQTKGTGSWDLMGGGNHNDKGNTPAGLTAFEKMLCGWQNPKELASDTLVTKMAALSSGGDAYIIINKAYPQEFFVMENRQRTGFDKCVPGEGLLIYHVDYNPYFFSVNAVNTFRNGNTRECCKLLVADGENNQNRQGCCFPTDMNDSFTNFSTPSSTLYHKNVDGTFFLSKPITKIRQEDGCVSFEFRNEANDQGYAKRYEFYVEEAGTLNTLIDENDMYCYDKLKINGYLNSSDILLLRKMSGRGKDNTPTQGILKELDLEETFFVKGGDAYYISTFGQEFNVDYETAFPTHSFYYTGIEKIILPKSVTAIGSKAFEWCLNLKHVVMPVGIVEIRREAFYGCESLTEICLPASVNLVGAFAFDKIDGIKKICSYSRTPPTAFDASFSSACYQNAVLYVPSGTAEAYRKAVGWKNFVNIEEAPQPEDVNEDGEVNIADTFAVLGAIAGTCDNVRADVNADGVLTLEDVTAIINYITSNRTNN